MGEVPSVDVGVEEGNCTVRMNTRTTTRINTKLISEIVHDYEEVNDYGNKNDGNVANE